MKTAKYYYKNKLKAIRQRRLVVILHKHGLTIKRWRDRYIFNISHRGKIRKAKHRNETRDNSNRYKFF